MRRGMLYLTLCALALIALAGCGPEDEVVQRQDVPTVEAGKIDPDEIEPIPQAAKFSGVSQDVAESIDKFVQAFNDGDAEYICTQGYSTEDLKVLDKDGGCVKGIKRATKLFDGYQLQIQEIRVKGDVADVKVVTVTRDLAKPKEALVRPIGLKFVREGGEWRMSINAAQSVENAQQEAQQGAQSGATGAPVE